MNLYFYFTGFFLFLQVEIGLGRVLSWERRLMCFLWRCVRE